MINLFKSALFCGAIFLSSSVNAELIANVPLDKSRFEVMAIDELISRANQGNNQAQFYLAKRYQTGGGIAVNTDKAIHWYTNAANQGVVPAQLNLGMMYALGDGTKVDESKARYWLEKAVQGGDNRASFALAMIEEKQQKLVDAYKWYDLSTRDGMLDNRVRSRAQSKIGQLALNLSASDIADAHRRADTWLHTK